MSVQGDPGESAPSGVGGSPWDAPDPWTSALWGRPDTVGGYAPQSDQQPPAPPPPPDEPRSTSRAVAVIAAVVAAVLLAGGALLTGALRSTDDPAAAAPRPSASALPSVPSAPALPTPTPPGSTAPPSAAPDAPPGVVPSPPGSAPESEPLTPEQSAAAAAVSKGLVDVNTTIGYDGAQGAGSGIVLTADGLVLTNHHVVEGSTSIRVTAVGNGTSYDATVVGYDSSHDVAVLRLKGASTLDVAPLGSSSTVQVGDDILAVGNAGGDGGAPSVVAGTVRALDQQITAAAENGGSAQRLTGLIEVDADVAPGDSGGALVDADGKVVGVVTAASTGALPNGANGSTLGYAIPIDQARSIAQQIIDGRSSSTVHIGGTAFLGVQIAPDSGGSGSAAGVTVADVVAGSTAERAGIRTGDVVTAIDGRPVASAAALRAAVSAHQPGDTVKVAWTDAAGKKHSATLKLGSGPVG